MWRKTLLALALLGPGLPSFAGLDQDLDRMFENMSNVTHPTFQMGQRRGVLSGGSVVIRNRVMSAHPVTLSPPAISGAVAGESGSA